MKKLLLFLFTLLFIFDADTLKAGDTNNFDTTNTNFVSLKSNGYVYLSASNGIMGEIADEGLKNWTDKKLETNVFFLPQQTGDLYVAIKLQSATGTCKLKISLDENKNGQEIIIAQGSEYTIVPVGNFTIKSLIYHHLAIKGVSKTGAYFPNIEAIVLSGEAAKNLKYNESQYRGAASVHLRYPVPGDSAVKWFYSEVMVPMEVEHSINAYYETNGFNSGYMGIQINSLTERRFIFSIWSLFNTNDPKEIPALYAVNLKQKGDGVFTGEFGNEGSGGHSHLVYPWQVNKTYRLLSGIKAMAGDSTTYIGYFATPDDGYKWHLISEWTQNKTDTKRGFRGLYSFVENFGDNGNDYFRAYYSNQWICTPAGNWVALDKASFTTTANPKKHQRYDYGAGVEGDKFYLFTGGFKQVNNIAPGDFISKPANTKPPVIDFNALK